MGLFDFFSGLFGKKSPDDRRVKNRPRVKRGTQVLIIDFDPASNRYAVEKSPEEPAELAALQHKHPRPQRVATRR